ncbi:hypothetical protein SAMD00019534_094960, partial [Acytostelium subglobosum LB1]|uniref:hypothetical protein n=1 Tax=Acytostelium subglobosum LB1 TaxID=1410327 RepID=UPI000644A4E7
YIYNNNKKMFFKKKKDEQPANKSPPQSAIASGSPNGATMPAYHHGIKIGSVANSASTEQLNQVAENKQKIPSLFRLLAEHKLTERDIWEGYPMLFSILYQFKDQLDRTDSGTASVITFHLPAIPEFADTRKKTYKINKKFTIAQTINLICKKQQVPDPKRFWIGSLQGFIMKDDEPLSTYGLGTIFESWELRVIYKNDILSKSPLKSEPMESIGTEFIVVFELPPLQEFNGLKKHVVKVDTNQTIKQSIANICRKYKVESPDRFSVMTMDENPLAEFVLFSGACFKHYGLGYKFKKWDLKIVFTDLIPPFVHRHTVIPMHGWAQVSPGQLDPFTARAIINDLEERCSEFQAEIRRLNQDIEGGNELSREQQAEIERLRQEIARLQALMEEERESTQAQNEVYESKLAAANAEIDTLSGQLRSMKARLDETNSQLMSAKIANEDLHSSLNLCQADKEGLEGQLQEAHATITDYIRKLENAKLAASEQEAQLTQMIATLEREKAAIREEARMNLERLSTEKVSSEEQAKAMLVSELQDELAALQREREMMALQLHKATVEKQEAVQTAERAEKKMDELSKNVKRVERQFGDLERERDVLRQQVQIKLDEIADLQKDIEWSRETTADLERRLTSASGEVKMFKDIKNKESARLKVTSAEESKVKGDLDSERKRNIDATAKFTKKLAEVEAAQKNQQEAYQNAEAVFKKREAELLAQVEEYRVRCEELQAGGATTSSTVAKPASSAAPTTGGFVKRMPTQSTATVEPIANTPVLLQSPDVKATNSFGLQPSTATLVIGGRDRRNSPPQEEMSYAKEQLKTFTPAPVEVATLDIANNLYTSLQSRFTNITDANGVEELNLSD